MATATTKKKPTKTAAAKPEKKPKVASSLPRSALENNDDVEIDPDALEFIAALDKYKKIHSRPFPSWSEVLFVIKQLGYRKPAPAT